MRNMEERDGVPPEVLPTLFIGKWTVKIIYALQQKPHRHGQLRRKLRTVSQRMLTRTLRDLESAGLISRHIAESNTPEVEYSLTRLGRTFITPLRGVCRWANRHQKELRAVVRYQKTQQKY